jgi:hypothetical protein
LHTFSYKSAKKYANETEYFFSLLCNYILLHKSNIAKHRRIIFFLSGLDVERRKINATAVITILERRYSYTKKEKATLSGNLFTHQTK